MDRIEEVIIDLVYADLTPIWKRHVNTLLTTLAEKDDEIKHHLLVLGESAKSEASQGKRIEEATSQVISLLAKTGGVEYRNRLEAILAALGKEGS